MFWTRRLLIWGLTVAPALAFLNAAADAASKSQSWIDLNFVPCEGMGATATGNVNIDVDFTSSGNTVKVTSLRLLTAYSHQHRPSGRVTYEKPTGDSAGINLQEPWFATIGPDDGSKSLFLPRLGSAMGAGAQTAFDMKAGTEIKVALTVLFPQHGGNCVSSFYGDLKLP